MMTSDPERRNKMVTDPGRRRMMTTDLERRIYSCICRHDGIKAREIGRETGGDRSEINRLLYASPFMRELCYRDDEYRWHGLIRQARPHVGLGDFCGYYSTVSRFRSLSEEEWLAELTEGCRTIGRNLNDTRGLLHSFRDTRQVMLGLFEDLESMGAGAPCSTPTSGGGEVTAAGEELVQYAGGSLSATDRRHGEMPLADWEICFEVRIKRARYIRIYADVLVIAGNTVFSLEFKMKDVIDPDEERQAVKYTEYMEVIFGDDYNVIPALVLTRAEDLYTYQALPGSTAEIAVCSGDMLFNLFDEYLDFLQ